MDLHQQADQPLIKYTPPKERRVVNVNWRPIDACPLCGKDKVRYSKLCFECRGGKVSPIDPSVFLIKGERCRNLPLTQSRYSPVDIGLYDYFMQWHWRFVQGYAKTSVYVDGKRKNVSLHHILFQADSWQRYDHINLCTWDNRKSNLRICDAVGNACNMGIKKSNTTGYIGVYKTGKTWISRVSVRGVTYTLGTFPTAIQAARRRDIEAIKLHGEFAYLNFPKSDYDNPEILASIYPTRLSEVRLSSSVGVDALDSTG